MFKKDGIQLQYTKNINIDTLVENLKSGSTYYWAQDSTIPIEITVTEDKMVHIVELENFDELRPLEAKEFVHRYIYYNGRKISRSEACDYVKNKRFELTKEQIALRSTDPDNADKRRVELLRYMEHEQNFISV